MAGSVVQVKSAAQNTGLATVSATFNSAATAGNLLILVIGADDYMATPPSGWTQSTGTKQETFLGHYVVWKVAAGGETSVSYTIGSASSSCWITAEISGVGSLDVSNGSLNASGSNTYTTPAVTPTAGNRFGIASIGGSLNANFNTGMGSWTNSYAEQADIATTLGAGTRDNIGLATLSFVASGGTTSTGVTWDGALSPQSQTGIILVFQETTAASIPYVPRAQPTLRDPGETYFGQLARRAAPGLLGTALLEDALLGGATTAGRATPQQQPAWLRREQVKASQAALPTLFDPTLAGSATARIMPATHDDRRLVPVQPPRLAPIDIVTPVGTGATNAWWSDDPAVAYIAATMPRYSDPSLLTPPATAADPLQFGPQTARRMPVTHADRRLVPAQRAGTIPLDDPGQMVGTGATGAWWSVDDWAHFGPAQRRQLADQSSQPASTPFDPTLAGYGWIAELSAVTHRDRRLVQQQRAVFAMPDDTVIVGTGATVAWWGVDDTAAYLGQRRPFDLPQTPPTPFDPTLAAWLPLWLAWNRAATHDDRRLVPQQRPYISDPSTYPAPPATADPLLLAGAVGGDTWRRYSLPAYADRREVPQQPQREWLYFDAGPGLPPLTLAWGAGGAYWHLYNRPSRPRPFWPQIRVLVVAECDCTTHRPNLGTTARPGLGITARPCSCND